MLEIIELIEGFLGEYKIYGIVILIFIVALWLYCMKIIIVFCANSYVRKRKDILYENNIDITSQCTRLSRALLDNHSTYCDYINDLGLNSTCDCSSSVLSNARRNPVNYIIKYSEIECDEYCLDRIEFCFNYVKDLENICDKFAELYDALSKQIPLIVRLFATKSKIPFWICNIDLALQKYEEPYFDFVYVSPAGRNQQDYSIIITSEILERIRGVLYEKISRVGHKKIQRSAMTNDLREAIKQRDHYTCCICGNSVYKEPNLLLEVDHIIPVSKGGKTEADNLQTLCWRCNRKKGNNI